MGTSAIPVRASMQVNSLRFFCNLPAEVYNSGCGSWAFESHSPPKTLPATLKGGIHVYTKMLCHTLTLALTMFAATMFLSATGAAQTEKVLYSFQNNGTDGGLPYSALIFDKLGNLYGTASAGGRHSAGTVFELVPSATGWHEKVIYNFAGDPDGRFRVAGLIMDKAGNL